VSTERPAEPYAVTCHACRAEFDATVADFCTCLTNERSLVCPHCSACFCKANHVYKKKFWENAPQSLWARKVGARSAATEIPPNPSPEEVTRPLVLVVEDEKDLQGLTTLALRDLGYCIVLARNGEEGLELTRRYRPDLVLSDALMPKLDGREMCRQIKDDPDLWSTKVVIMTALYTSPKYKIEALKTFRADDFLAKPLEVAALREVLAKHIGNA
jgi:CheY-like chemotaxis protein